MTPGGNRAPRTGADGSPGDLPPPAPDSRPPSFWQVIASVLAAFFGVQSSSNRERDFRRGRAVHYIAIGLAATILFVLAVVLAVRFALRQAGL
ncbi:MAG: DUF2970 domain-containing protein [Gammaproteobacteria bacterium]|nr:DUF2970 domain-containing protein [Gammaproteobacteria bacterium]